MHKDDSGWIESKEFLEGVRHNGMIKQGRRVATDAHLLKFFKAIDVDNSGVITEDEFVNFVSDAPQIRGSYTADALEELLEAKFKEADANGDGTLQPEEFDAALRGLEMGLSDIVIEMMRSAADEDGDGLITYSEFMPVMASLRS